MALLLTLLLARIASAAVDLQVTGTTLQTNPTAPGGPTRIDFGIRNLGTTTAVAPSAELRIGANLAAGFAAATPIVTLSLANLAGGASRELTSVFNAPAVPGTYYVWVRVLSTETQTNTTNDTLVSAALTVAATIDLRIFNVSLRTPAAPPGAAVIIGWHTSNRGTIPAPATTTRLFLTNSNLPNGVGTTIATIPTQVLDPNESIETLYRFNAPTTPGTYYVWVESRASGTLDDVDATNNRDVSQALTVVNGTIDVQPTTPSLSATTVAPGTSFSATWTIRNNGTVAAGSSETLISLTTSNAPNGFGVSPIVIGDPSTGTIAPGGAVTQNRTITAPANLGTYYLWIIASGGTVKISESNLTNNHAVSTALTVAPPGTVDVQPSNIALSSTSVAPGASVTATWLVRNNANAPALGSNSQLRLTTSNAANGFGSAANNVGAPLNTGSIAAGASITQARTFSAPATPGIYYLWVVADVGGTLTQSSTANDTAVSVPLIVTQPGFVDLQPQTIALSSTNVAPGASITATWQIRNNGNISAPSSDSQLRLTSSNTSPGNTSNNAASPQPTGAIGAGVAVSQTAAVTAPAAAGTYYLWVLADSGGAVTQSTTGNDTLVSLPFVVTAPTLLPNLAPGNVTLASNSISAGDPITLTWTLANTGNGAAPATSTGVTLNQSPIDPRATPAVALNSVALPALTAGASLTQTAAAVLPASTPPGTYYFWIKADEPTGATALIQSDANDDYARSAPLQIKLPRAANRLANIATRGMVGSDTGTMIAGFVITGSIPKPVLIRAVGPGLSAFNIPGIVGNTRLQLFRGTTMLLENDDWGTNASALALTQAANAVGAFALLPNSLDAALLVTLDPGNYSAQVNGVGGASGVALVEVYDASDATQPARLANISTRAQVGVGGGALIAGLVIAGDQPKSVLVRAVGPSLAQFGLDGVLADPRLELYRGDTLITENDNWGGSTALGNAFSQIGAFALPAASRDAALLLTLQPGAYTAQVSGVSGATGVALVEIYELP